MLTTILNNIPVPKCVVIQDCISIPGKGILHSIIRAHLNLKKYNVHFFAFESNPHEIKSQFVSSKLEVYDYLTLNGWLDDANIKNFPEFVEKNKLTGVIVIDSLAHFILEYGVVRTYKILHKLLNQPGKITWTSTIYEGVMQIATVLHDDVLLNKSETLKYIGNISTLTLKLHIVADRSRVEYMYKKPGGKVIQKIEDYYFKDNVFYTKVLEKIDPKLLLTKTTSEQLPENMSTFKISLDDNEKKSREQLNLPYMKHTNTNKSNINQSGQITGGNVIYNLDDDDDWDDEDPDDDLDI